VILPLFYKHSMTIKEIIQQSNTTLQSLSPTPDLDTYIIIEYVLGLNKLEAIMHQDDSIPNREIEAIQDCIQERLTHKPIAYIIGHKEFYGRDFVVNEQVLIPRPETEAIIDITKTLLKDITNPIIWEIGTGSGCIAVTLALEMPNTDIYASDISPLALQIAQNNAILITGKQSLIKFFEGNLIDAFPQELQPNLIIANLPYLDQNQYTDDSLLYEPDLALYSNNNGLEHYIRLIQDIKSRFIVYPKILIEINPEQVSPLQELIHTIFISSRITIYKDLQELDRHILIEFNQ
jgi:release factor glutamine methyltransferase